ncbi:hypothetical protein RRG08_014443 [Elysia crispata]|uniref:Uncharacterized protein n=1 Tax=Elysia crispata TaxID=231223 RepID=A0AAE1CJ07_9GAST|nr:hypothetical protein RRG08_014443 [Elysia crispata]
MSMNPPKGCPNPEGGRHTPRNPREFIDIPRNLNGCLEATLGVSPHARDSRRCFINPLTTRLSFGNVSARRAKCHVVKP